MLTKGIADRYAMALLALAPAIEELNLYDDQLDSIIAMDAKDEDTQGSHSSVCRWNRSTFPPPDQRTESPEKQSIWPPSSTSSSE